MSRLKNNIIPTCELATIAKSKLDEDQIVFLKRGLRRCGFLLADFSIHKLSDQEIEKGLDTVWAGRPRKSIWKTVAFGQEMLACDFRLSFQTVTIFSQRDGEPESVVNEPRCVFCYVKVDITKAPGDHIYNQECYIKWINHKIKKNSNAGMDQQTDPPSHLSSSL